MLTRGKSPVPGTTCSRRVSRRKPRKTSTATPQQRRKETTDRMKGNITILSVTTRRLDAHDPCAPSTRTATFLPSGHCQAICQMIQLPGIIPWPCPSHVIARGGVEASQHSWGSGGTGDQPDSDAHGAGRPREPVDRARRTCPDGPPWGRTRWEKRCSPLVILLVAVPTPVSSFRLLTLACRLGNTSWKR